MKHWSSLIAASAVAVAITSTSSALAEEQPKRPGTDVEAAATTLESVTVTVRRHAEDAQSVPISMTVLEGRAVDDLPTVSSNAAIARSSPNFSFVDNGGHYSNVASIRGVGSLFVLSPDDTSVPFYVDEVPLSVLSVPPSTLDMSRIEVLRGPQGTLYGRNSQGGAVNFVPNRPEFFRSLQFRGEAGSNGWGLGEVIANATFSEALAGRLALQYSKRDGDVRNLVAGGKDGKTEVGSARGSLLFAPDADTSALLTFSHHQFDDTNPLWVLRDAGCYPCSGLDPRNDFRRNNSGVNLRIEKNLRSVRFTSITSHQRYRARTAMDLTDSVLFPPFLGLPGEVMNDPNENIVHGTFGETSWFQEFRLSSVEGSPVMWTAGLNHLRSSYDSGNNGESITWSSFAGYSGRWNLHLKARSYAAFGEAAVPLTNRLKGIAGLRVTHEGREANYAFLGSGVSGTAPSHWQEASVSDTFITGRVGLTYDWSDTLMTYATIGRGAVAGGLPTMPRNIMFGQDERTFPTSTSLTYETGLKSTLWGGRALLNASVFYNDVKQGRLSTRDRRAGGLSSFIISTLDYESYGAEVETRIRMTKGLTIFGGVGYTHARLKNVPADTLTGARSGNRLSYVPQWSGTVGAEYRVPGARWGLGSGQLYANAAYEYVGARATDLQNSLDISSYGLVNARMGWQGKTAGVYLFANNLTDKKYEVIGANYGPGAEAVRSGVGRTVGIGATFNF